MQDVFVGGYMLALSLPSKHTHNPPLCPVSQRCSIVEVIVSCNFCADIHDSYLSRICVTPALPVRQGYIEDLCRRVVECSSTDSYRISATTGNSWNTASHRRQAEYSLGLGGVSCDLFPRCFSGPVCLCHGPVRMGCQRW